MLKTYEAIYDHGHIRWIDALPKVDSARLIITLLPGPAEQIEITPERRVPPDQIKNKTFVSGGIVSPILGEDTTPSSGKLAWDMLVELRKELVESQRIRTQIISLKITAISGGVGWVAANLEKVPPYVLIVASFSALFFDLIINSYSFSIKRIGYYIRCNIEPILKKENDWPLGSPLWEEFMIMPGVKQRLSHWGNSGMTFLVVVVGIASLYMPSQMPQLPELWRLHLGLMLIILSAIVYKRVTEQFRFDKPE